jgi:hypothetical protein
MHIVRKHCVVCSVVCSTFAVAGVTCTVYTVRKVGGTVLYVVELLQRSWSFATNPRETVHNERYSTLR